MLKLLSNNNAVLPVDDFYILEKSTGLDELVFNISINDENYPYILEEAVIEYEQPYVIKAIDGGSEKAKIKCQLDLTELKADMYPGFTNNSNTLAGTIENVLPKGWLFVDHSGSTIRRTVEGDYTPYEIIVACAETYDVAFRFKPREKQVHAYDLKLFQPLGAFASRELNLKDINYKGKSTDFFTRLYAYGKDGLSFADINDGKEYVDNFTYSDKVISAIMRDNRYTTKEGLLEAAQKQVASGGIPIRSYSCDVIDLAKTNPDLYSFQDFSLFSVVKLIDGIKQMSVNYQVVEYKRYPLYPEKNVVTLSTTAAKIQNTVKNLRNEIENPQSSFRTMLQNTIDSMAASIAGYDGGNMLVTHNKDGKPNGIMIMDTDSKTTAKKVLWLNLNGITYSENGVDGPYNTVWSFEQGGFVADYIIAGTMLADRIKGGTLTLGGKDNGDGVCSVLDAEGKEIVRLSVDGISFSKAIFNMKNISDETYPIELTGTSGQFIKIGPYWVRMEDSGDRVEISRDHIYLGTLDGTAFSPNLRFYTDGRIISVYALDTVVSDSPNMFIASNGVFKRSSSSSKQYKKDITENIPEELDPSRLYDVPVKSFKYKDGYLSKGDMKEGKDVIGFIVEDLEQYYPSAVQYVDGKPEMWNANILIPAMMKLIQEQNERLKNLEVQHGN